MLWFEPKQSGKSEHIKFIIVDRMRQLKEGTEPLFKQELNVFFILHFLDCEKQSKYHFPFILLQAFPRWSWLVVYIYQHPGYHTSVPCPLVFVKPKFYTHSMWPVKINLKETCKFNQESPFADRGEGGTKLPWGSNSFIFIQFLQNP